jgi:[ribosomal protein S5]-alanine N-acetyltransferase
MIKEIESERLILRKLRLEDCHDLFEYTSNAEVAKYVSWNKHDELEQATKYIQKVMDDYEEGDNPYVWAIEYKENGKMIGTMEFFLYSKKNQWCELESDMNPLYWNKGLNTEALKAIIEYCFNTLQLNKVQARCYAENKGSAKVLKKAGMTYEGTMRQHLFSDGQFHDILRFSILKEEFLNQGKQISPNQFLFRSTTL